MDSNEVMSILRCFDRHDLHEDLLWRFDGDEISFFVNCNDAFYPGSSDGEVIRESDLIKLESAIDDVKAIEPCYEPNVVILLFCSRKRKKRPITGALPSNENLRKLFEL